MNSISALLRPTSDLVPEAPSPHALVTPTCHAEAEQKRRPDEARSRFGRHASRITHHVSRFTFHALHHRTSHFPLRTFRQGFTLMEVMIAMGIFFMAVFAILGLVSNTLRNARALQTDQLDASSFVAAFSNTNKLYEGRYELNSYPELDDVYKHCSGWADCQEVGTNGLFQVDFTLQRRVGGASVETTMSALFFRPESPPGGHGVPIGRP